eukprot:3182916-Prymnesium_polylepis.3
MPSFIDDHTRSSASAFSTAPAGLAACALRSSRASISLISTSTAAATRARDAQLGGQRRVRERRTNALR